MVDRRCGAFVDSCISNGHVPNIGKALDCSQRLAHYYIPRTVNQAGCRTEETRIHAALGKEVY